MDTLVRSLLIEHDDRPLEHILEDFINIPNLLELTLDMTNRYISVAWSDGQGKVRTTVRPNGALVIYPFGGFSILSREEVAKVCVPASAASADDVENGPTEKSKSYAY